MTDLLNFLCNLILKTHKSAAKHMERFSSLVFERLKSVSALAERFQIKWGQFYVVGIIGSTLDWNRVNRVLPAIVM